MTFTPQIFRSAVRTTLEVEVKSDLSVIVRVPLSISDKEINRFIKQKETKKEKTLKRIGSRQRPYFPNLSQNDIKALAEKAAKVIPEKTKYYAPLIGVNYAKITIRNQTSRWGSCSSNGNLSFNCLLMLCPDSCIDYVVVHELCHRKELNHSPRFWRLVENILPDYKARRAWLRENGSAIVNSMIHVRNLK